MVHRGYITKQGSKWCAGPPSRRFSAHQQRKPLPMKERIAARRGHNIAKVAAARKLLTQVYYGLRDDRILALAKEAA